MLDAGEVGETLGQDAAQGAEGDGGEPAVDDGMDLS